MKRFFAFGCSYTYYCYPTWADIVGTQFDEYYNSALFGGGNTMIAQMVHEADMLKKFTPDDTVVVLMTSSTRYDSYIDQTWQWRGSVFSETNKSVYTEQWHRELWSVEQGIMDSWRAQQSIINLLKTRGVKYYRILTAFPILGDDWGGDVQANIKSPTVLDMAKSFTESVDNKSKTLFETIQPLHTRAPQKFYRFNFGMDGHPTVPMHLDLVKRELPELYHGSMEQRVQHWDKSVKLTDHNDNWQSSEFAQYRGQRIGTLSNLKF